MKRHMSLPWLNLYQRITSSNPLEGAVRHLHEVVRIPQDTAPTKDYIAEGGKDVLDVIDPAVARVVANRKHREEQLAHVSKALNEVENYRLSHPEISISAPCPAAHSHEKAETARTHPAMKRSKPMMPLCGSRLSESSVTVSSRI